MSRSAAPTTRNEATGHMQPPKVTPFAELTIGTAIGTSRGRLRTVANGCEHKRNVERTHPQPRNPKSETGTLATHSAKIFELFAFELATDLKGLSLTGVCTIQTVSEHFFSIESTFKKFGQGPNCANVAPLIPINVAAAQARTTSLPDHRVGERTKCINKHQKTTTEKFRLFAALPLSILHNYTIERNAIHELFRAEWCIIKQCMKKG